MSSLRTPGSLVLIVASSLVAVALQAQDSSRVGRWVETDPAAIPLVLDVERDGTVRQFLPAPQFTATYRAEGERVVVTHSDGSKKVFTLDGDTLLADGKPAYTRVPNDPGPDDKSSVGGAWTGVGGPMPSVATFRSDGQLILEVTLPTATTAFTQDSLKLLDKAYAVRQVSDELFLEAAGKSRWLVRRPWGCFGTALDGQAPECR